MPKPHTATGWWGVLINVRAGGKVNTLAELMGVSDRTVRRWRTGADLPRGKRLEKLRVLAGKLTQRKDTPEFLNATIDTNN